MQASEVKSSSNNKVVVFKGEKLREVEIASTKKEHYLDLFSILHDCAFWIFVNLQDSETKHTLMNHHLAFEWVGEEKWPNRLFIERAFTSARESYKLHLQESSKELLKAFAEIKKSLLEEVNKVSDNSHGLISNLWRDFAIAAAVLVIKFATTSSNLSPAGIRILFTATSAFLLLSLTLNIVINARFNRIAKDSRSKWYQRLYPFIDKVNLEELVNKPISKGLMTYRCVVAVTFLIYLAMSFYLLNTAFSWY